MIYLLVSNIDNFQQKKACNHVLTETCIVISCEQVAPECFTPCTPQPCTPQPANCTIYDLFYSLERNGKNYTKREQADLGCPLTAICRFYPCRIDKTLTLGQPSLDLDKTDSIIGIVLSTLGTILMVLGLIIIIGVLWANYPFNNPNPMVRMPENA
jgi:hypothetical protein